MEVGLVLIFLIMYPLFQIFGEYRVFLGNLVEVNHRVLVHLWVYKSVVGPGWAVWY